MLQLILIATLPRDCTGLKIEWEDFTVCDELATQTIQ